MDKYISRVANIKILSLYSFFLSNFDNDSDLSD